MKILLLVFLSLFSGCMVDEVIVRPEVVYTPYGYRYYPRLYYRGGYRYGSRGSYRGGWRGGRRLIHHNYWFLDSMSKTYTLHER